VLALEKHGMKPADGPVVVTGAAGCVGSVAIALLAKAGWHVIASTGRAEEADYLKGLGAAEIIDRNELSGSGRPLGKERWIAGVDAVGSHTLANLLSMTKYGGAIAACGLAQGMDLPASVAPFILRGVALLGVDSVMCPKPRRLEAWARLASDLDRDRLAAMTTTIPLEDVVETGRAIALAGLHPATGGSGAELCSGDMLLEALVACAGVTLKAVATALEIELKKGVVRAEGDLDFRGTLGVAKDAAVGFKAIRLFFDVETDAPQEKLDTLLKLTERYCVVFQTLNVKPELSATLQNNAS